MKTITKANIYEIRTEIRAYAQIFDKVDHSWEQPKQFMNLLGRPIWANSSTSESSISKLLLSSNSYKLDKLESPDYLVKLSEKLSEFLLSKELNCSQKQMLDALDDVLEPPLDDVLDLAAKFDMDPLDKFPFGLTHLLLFGSLHGHLTSNP